MHKTSIIILTVLIGIFILWRIMSVSERGNTNNTSLHTNLRVAFPRVSPSTDYDPSEIKIDSDYIFLENIFSPLVEFDEYGDLTSGIAEQFFVEPGKIKFVIRQGIETIDGYEITSEDVEFSLKRILTLNHNTHGDLNKALCLGKLSSINEPCPGIRITSRYEIELLVDKPNPFLVPMLAAIDFAVIPKQSVDLKTLKIRDYRNTSGPYYVASDDGKGSISLKVNQNHYHFSSNIAQTVELVGYYKPTDGKDGLKLFDEKKVDLVTTIDRSDSDSVIKYYDSHKEDVVLHQTRLLNVSLFYFTPHGLADLSLPERLNIGQTIKEVLIKDGGLKQGSSEALQLFPSSANGALTKTQFDQLKQISNNNKISQSLKKINIWWVINDSETLAAQRLSANFPNSNVLRKNTIPAFEKHLNKLEEPHAVIVRSDISFMIDFSFLSYSFRTGILGVTEDELSTWLDSFTSENEPEKRLKMLNELHFKLLSEARVFPVISSPYTALVRKGWHFNLSQLYANSPIWKIIRD